MSGPRCRRNRAAATPVASAFVAAWVAGLIVATPAGAATGQISKLSDVNFSLLNPLVSTSSAQNLCVYSSGLTKMYSIKATGSGSGGAFTVNAGAGLDLAYGVQWSASSGQSSGTSMSPGVNLTGLTSTALTATCTLGATTTASLIVTLNATDLQAAVAGITYTGSLTLLLTPQ